MTVQLFGIGKTAFHRFFAPLIQSFPRIAQPVLINTLDTVLPDMSGDHFGGIATVGAGTQQRAADALRGVGVILPIAFARGGAIAND